MIIQKDIPLPSGDWMRTSSGRHKYPFRDMEVGDSFLVQTKEDRNRVKANASYYVRTEGQGRKFVTRKVSDGYRIWRFA